MPLKTRTAGLSSAACDACPAGFAAEEEGSTACSRCAPGHKAVAGSKCEQCEKDKFVKSDLMSCADCPTKGVTCDGGVISIKEGYWLPPAMAGSVTAEGDDHLDEFLKIVSDNSASGPAPRVTLHSRLVSGTAGAVADPDR